MAKEWGEPEIMKGTGLRSSTNVAIAPTKSTARIMGQASQGIQPIISNSMEQTTANDQPYYRNANLADVLRGHGMDTEEVWDSIDSNNGSVAKLDFLSHYEKDVFKTANEIDQSALIRLAADRQKHIDQGQSLNLFFHPDTPPKHIAKMFFLAHELGLKTLYYQYTGSAAEEFNRKQLECTSCEG
jgi:ribonucleoside-diphosphate reductase alpha chain